MKKRLLAVAVNWNGVEDSVELLDSMPHQGTESLSVLTCIVDNGSSPEQLTRLRKECRDREGVVLVENGWNAGAPGGYNAALERLGCDWDYLLRLDNDVVLEPGAVPLLVRALEEWRGRGARLVGGEIRYFERPADRNAGAVRIELVRGRTSLHFPDEDALVQGILGCVMLVDRDILNVRGPRLFDERLFLTTDESELSLFAEGRGWRTLYVATPLARHKGARSVAKASESARYFSVRNWTYLQLSYVRGPWKALVLARLAATLGILVIKGRQGAVRALLAGLKFFMDDAGQKGPTR